MNQIMRLAALACLLTGCTPDPHKVGVWEGPTGANVAQMVASHVNFSGGAGGRRLVARVVAQRAVVQGELTPEMLYASLDSMANDPQVLAIVTRVNDSITERATRAFERARVPYLITTPVARNYAATHPHAFMLAPSLEDQAEFMVRQALREPAPRRAAIMHVRELGPDSLAAHIKRQLEARGVPVVFTTSFSQAADEYNLVAKAQELAAQNPTILFWIGRSPSLMVVHPVVRNRNTNLRLISNDLTESFHLYMNPNGVFTGIRFLRYMNPEARDSAILAVRERMVMWLGRDELNNEAALTYDALYAIADAIKAGASTRERLTEYLRKRPTMTGLAGTVTFGEDQRVGRPMHLAEMGTDSSFVVKH